MYVALEFIIVTYKLFHALAHCWVPPNLLVILILIFPSLHSCSVCTPIVKPAVDGDSWVRHILL